MAAGKIVGALAASLLLVLVGQPSYADTRALGGSARADGESSAEEAPYFARERGISVAEAQRRLDWQIVAPDLAERLEQDLGDRFGGVWIDVNDRDRVKAAVSGEVDRTSAAIIANDARAVGLADYDLVAVPHSARELQAAMDWARPQLVRVNAGAELTLAMGVRTDLNAVQLSLPRSGGLTGAQQDFVRAAGDTLKGLLVFSSFSGSFEPFACVFPYCDAPLRGSVKINGPDTWCSSAFIAQSKVDSKLYMMTAGHCGMHTGMWNSKTTDLVPHDMGNVHHWEYHSEADYAIIDIGAGTGWNPQPFVTVTQSPATTENFTYHIASDKTSVVGMRICTTGVATKVSNCGHVTELDLTGTYGGVTVHHLGRSSNCGKPGDSGAPMFASHVAYGIVVGGHEGECDVIYQGIRAAEKGLNVNVLH